MAVAVRHRWAIRAGPMRWIDRCVSSNFRGNSRCADDRCVSSRRIQEPALMSREVQFTRRVPPGDDIERAICDRCGFVDYENPRIVVGSVATFDDRVLLCRRAIEPRSGYWTLPAGYLERNESPEQGALREAWEEARARLQIDQLLATYAITRISQVQLIYRARLADPEVSAGPESREVRLFSWRDLPPSDQIAFPSVRWALEDFLANRSEAVFAPRTRSDAGVDEEIR
jgi:ADP-ribose pyrophosphatase YjhB (NUDIX family)